MEEPGIFFISEGAYIFSKNENIRANYTIEELQLNRSELLEVRKDRLEKIQLLVRLFNQASNKNEKEAILGEIKTELGNEKQYSFFAKNYAILNKFEI